jgi:hypothetical protein
MSDSPRKKPSNVAVAVEYNSTRKGLVKLDLSQLEKVIQDLYGQNQTLNERINHLEVSLNKEEQIFSMQRNIDLVSEENRRTTVSIGNIQAKIIDIEKEFLRYDQRTKGVEIEIKVARNAEKNMKDLIQRESKMLSTKIFDLDRRVPEIVKQFISPLDDKVLMAYSIIDEVEQQVDDVEDKVKELYKQSGKPLEESDEEYSDDEELDNELSLFNQGSPSNKNIEEASPDGKNFQSNEEKKIDAPKTKKSSKGKSKKDRKKRREELRKARENMINSVYTNSSIEDLKQQIDERFKEMELRIKEGRYAIDNQFDIASNEKIVVSFNEFADKQAEGKLFDETEEGSHRVDIAKFQLHEIENKRKLDKNNKVVYEMYNKYRYLLEELEVYKDKLIEQIEEIKAEEEEEGDRKDNPNADLDNIIFKGPEHESLTQKQKDYKFHILAKELKLARWNSTLEGAVNILKVNNINNNAHIREQKVMLDGLIERLNAADDNSKAIRESLQDFKNETKTKIKNMPKESELNKIIVNGQLDPLSDLVLKLTHHIKTKIVAELHELDKNKAEPFDPKKIEGRCLTIENSINQLIMMIGDKLDKSYIEGLEVKISKIIENYQSSNIEAPRSQEKDLFEEEKLERKIKEMIKNEVKVTEEVSSTPVEINFGHFNELKKDIKRNEQKLDRIYHLMELNAFGKDEDSSEEEEDDIPDDNNDSISKQENEDQTVKEDQDINNDQNSLIKLQPAKSVYADDQSEGGIAYLVPNNRTKTFLRSEKEVSITSIPKIQGNKSLKKSKDRQVSNKKFNGLKLMFVELESRVEQIDKRLYDIEFSDQLIANAAEELATGSGMKVHSKGNLIIQTEFNGVKHLMGRQQISIKKIENVIKQINEWKNELNLSKLYDDHQSDLEILKKYIEEVNDYNQKLFKSTESQLSGKADFNIMQEFTQNVENKVMKDLTQKIDKIEHKRMQNSIRKKLEAIEKEVVEMNIASMSGNKPFKSAFLQVNDKCISCNKAIGENNDLRRLDEKAQKRVKSKYMFKELYQNARKLGGGFSRVLGTIENSDDINILTANGSFSKEDDSTFTNNSPDISQNINLGSLSSTKNMNKLSNSVSKNPSTHRRSDSYTKIGTTILPSIRSSVNTLNLNEIDLPEPKGKNIKLNGSMKKSKSKKGIIFES